MLGGGRPRRTPGRLREELEFAARWQSAADEIKADILDNGVDERGVFTQHYETDALDASVLLMVLPLPAARRPAHPSHGARDRRRAHRGRARAALPVDETDDGLAGEEGTFTICSFWLVSALVEIGEVERARDCARGCCLRQPLGLYAEEIDPRTGRHLGNFPQAFTHLALINAVMHVIRADQGLEVGFMPWSVSSRGSAPRRPSAAASARSGSPQAGRRFATRPSPCTPPRELLDHHEARPNARTGMTSLSPVLDRVVKLRKSSSIQVRSPPGSTAAVNVPARWPEDDIRVGEGPGDEGEGGADGEQLVAGDHVVLEHVRDQRARGVEVEDRLERRRVGEEVVVAGDRLDQEQDGRGPAEDERDAGDAGGLDRQDHEAEERDAEEAEDGAPDIVALHRRIEEHAGELPGEQDRGRLAAGHREHDRKLMAGPVGPWRSGPAQAVEALVELEDTRDRVGLGVGDHLIDHLPIGEGALHLRAGLQLLAGSGPLRRGVKQSSSTVASSAQTALTSRPIANRCDWSSPWKVPVSTTSRKSEPTSACRRFVTSACTRLISTSALSALSRAR